MEFHNLPELDVDQAVKRARAPDRPKDRHDRGALTHLYHCDEDYARCERRLRMLMPAKAGTPVRRNTDGSGTAAARLAQSCGVTSDPAALRPKLPASRL